MDFEYLLLLFWLYLYSQHWRRTKDTFKEQHRNFMGLASSSFILWSLVMKQIFNSQCVCMLLGLLSITYWLVSKQRHILTSTFCFNYSYQTQLLNYRDSMLWVNLGLFLPILLLYPTCNLYRPIDVPIQIQNYSKVDISTTPKGSHPKQPVTSNIQITIPLCERNSTI